MTIAEIICIQRILVIQWIYTRTESTVIEQKSREQSLEIHFIQLYSDGVSQRTLNVNVPALEENTLDNLGYFRVLSCDCKYIPKCSICFVYHHT